MWILLAAVALQGNAPEAPKKKDNSITVTGKAQRVCFRSVVTGSRARGGKVCTTKGDASADAVASREAAREAMEISRVREALKCDPLNSNGCA
jgi:hypothetical protein